MDNDNRNGIFYLVLFMGMVGSMYLIRPYVGDVMAGFGGFVTVLGIMFVTALLFGGKSYD